MGAKYEDIIMEGLLWRLLEFKDDELEKIFEEKGLTNNLIGRVSLLMDLTGSKSVPYKELPKGSYSRVTKDNLSDISPNILEGIYKDLYLDYSATHRQKSPSLN